MAYTEEDLEIAIGANNVAIALEIQLQGIFNLVKRAGDSSKLQIACQNQAEDMVDLILAQPGIYLDYQNASGNSALHDAVRQNHPGIVAKLFKAGASPNLRTADRGETPLLMLLRTTIENNLSEENAPNTGETGVIQLSTNGDKVIRSSNEDELTKAIKLSLQPDDLTQAIQNSLADGGKAEDEAEEQSKVNYQLFDLLFDHPQIDLSIQSVDPNDASNLNPLDYLINSKYEDHRLMEYLLSKLIERKVNLDLTATYRRMFYRGCGCGAHTPPGSIFYLEDILRVGYTPDLEGQKFYFWLLKEIGDHPQRETILKLVNQYVDRSNLYQENSDPNSCSILEVLLENQDLEMIQKLYQDKENPLAINRICQQHGQTPFQHWLENLPVDTLSLETFSEIYQMIEKFGGKWPTTRRLTDPEREIRDSKYQLVITALDSELKVLLVIDDDQTNSNPIGEFRQYFLKMVEYYQFDSNSPEMKKQFEDHLLEMGASQELVTTLLVEFTRLIEQYVIPNQAILYPKDPVYCWWKASLFQNSENLPIFQYLINHHPILFDDHLTREEKIISLRSELPAHLIKTVLLKQTDSNLIINRKEFVSHESIETIPDEDLIILTNGVVWDQHNLIGYIIHNAKGINKFDQHIPHEHLRGQPIWSPSDYQMFLNRSNSFYNVRAEYVKLIDYLNFAKYSKDFTAVEKESLRRFTSIFWARGAWWDLEIKKVLSAEHLKEWESVKGHINSQSMPATSSELRHHLANLKARYLHLYRDFYYGLSEKTRTTMTELNQTLSKEYSRQTIEGEECIMCYGQSMAKLLAKLNLDLNVCQPQILRENQEFPSPDPDEEESVIEKEKEKEDEEEEEEEDSSSSNYDSDEGYNLIPNPTTVKDGDYQEDYEDQLPHLLKEIPYDSGHY